MAPNTSKSEECNNNHVHKTATAATGLSWESRPEKRKVTVDDLLDPDNGTTEPPAAKKSRLMAPYGSSQAQGFLIALARFQDSMCLALWA